ncbi:hypothetical protein EDD29_3447 [Actinocorallia herbida]|uniref:Acetyltransferase (GNAT) family protein n=1 Tax=Actinocorallia herbida TaxID=58109 RepID=A0A3N1CX72_9ACTN|nr:GNAT family N-acetyltransferase [Actinocorallia herbida]ROO85893.1 hypothetical protein EDD29_3447 [Actinocorallia herbida]
MNGPEVLSGGAGPVELRRSPRPPDAAVRSLLARARRADAEMGFAAPAGAAAARTTTVEVFTRLRRGGVAASPEPGLAAVLVIAETRPSLGVADLVVAPEYRSMGVATAVAETLGAGLSGARGFGTDLGSVLACAYGTHPAALRLARRFGVAPTGERHRLVLPSRLDHAGSPLALASAAPGVTVRESEPDPSDAPSAWTALDRGPGEPTALVVTGPDGGVRGRVSVGMSQDGEHGPLGTIRELTASTRTHRDDLLRLSLTWLWRQGAQAITTAVEVTDLDALDLFRSAAFQHDRTDTLFTLP